MNKKASFEINELITVIKYLLILVILLGIMAYLGSYLINEIDLSNIFKLR